MHSHPLIAVAGKHGELQIEMQAEIAYHGFSWRQKSDAVDVPNRRKAAPRAAAGAGFNSEYRVASYKYLLGIIGRAVAKSGTTGFCRPDAPCLCAVSWWTTMKSFWKSCARTALVDGYFPKELQRERYELIKRAQALTDSPRCRFLQKGTEPRTKQELALALEKVVRAEPALIPPTPGPWDRVQTLLDLSRSGESQIQSVQLMGKQVYAAIGSFDKDHKPTLQVVRIAVPDGVPNYLAKTNVNLTPSILPARQSVGSWINFITAMAIGNDVVYVATQTDGIYAFPISGAAARRIGTTQGLPTDHVTALALLDDKLYAGLQNGYLIAYDPAASRCDVLASSQPRRRN